MQPDELTQFRKISKMILEKKPPLKESLPDITKQNLWTKTCKKQLWIVPDYSKEKTEATSYACTRQINFCVKL